MDNDNDAGPSQPKRKRSAYSCTECMKAKAKCDRQQPCSRCVVRRIARRCQYLSEGYEDQIDPSKDIRERLIRMERKLDGLQASAHGIRAAHASPTTPSLGQMSVQNQTPTGKAEERRRSTRRGFTVRGRYFGPSAMRQVGNGSSDEIVRALEPADSHTPTGAQDQDRRPQRLLVDLVHELPPRAMCDNLIATYMERVNETRYPISRQSLSSWYNPLWSKVSLYALDANDAAKLPLLFVILAIATLIATREDLGLPVETSLAQLGDIRLSRAHALFQVSRRALVYLEGLPTSVTDLSLVMADLLTVRYTILVRRAPDATTYLGSAIARAQAYGLHRQPDGESRGSAEEARERRLAWSYIYHMDRYTALLLGRPLMIHDCDCDVHPLEIVLDMGPDLDLTELFLIARDKLARLIGRIVIDIFGLHEPRYSEVLDVDLALQAWVAELPAPFALQAYIGDPAVRLEFDGHNTMVDVQAHFLLNEYTFARITMHRAYLVRPDRANLYAASRQACVGCALTDLRARTEFSFPGMENLSTGSYRVANSLIILGLALLTGPGADLALSIQQCLTDFASVRHANPNILTQQKVEEAAIIELLQMHAEHNLNLGQSGSVTPNTAKDTAQPAAAISPWTNGNGAAQGQSMWPSVPSMPPKAPYAPITTPPSAPLAQDTNSGMTTSADLAVLTEWADPANNWTLEQFGELLRGAMAS